ncbi:MAG: hypothetical protein IT442_03400 [Phycisphaeraceae bacterium]|nr:hypothetical protein [Phycisphaeraceae bacterium]
MGSARWQWVRLFKIAGVVLVALVVLLAWDGYREHRAVMFRTDLNLRWRVLSNTAEALRREEGGGIELTSAWRALSESERERLANAPEDAAPGAVVSEYMRDKRGGEMRLFGRINEEGKAEVGVLSAGMDGAWGTSDDVAWPGWEVELFRRLADERKE